MEQSRHRTGAENELYTSLLQRTLTMQLTTSDDRSKYLCVSHDMGELVCYPILINHVSDKTWGPSNRGGLR